MSRQADKPTIQSIIPSIFPGSAPALSGTNERLSISKRVRLVPGLRPGKMICERERSAQTDPYIACQPAGRIRFFRSRARRAAQRACPLTERNGYGDLSATSRQAKYGWVSARRHALNSRDFNDTLLLAWPSATPSTRRCAPGHFPTMWGRKRVPRQPFLPTAWGGGSPQSGETEGRRPRRRLPLKRNVIVFLPRVLRLLVLQRS